MNLGVKGRQRKLVADLLKRGWTMDRITGSGHLKLTHPRTGQHVIVSRTPSDGRGWYNLRAKVRRIEAS